jgi:hypothetical protein
MRRFSIDPCLRGLRPSELVALIRSGGADVLPFVDDEGRVVVIPATEGFAQSIICQNGYSDLAEQ